MGTFNNSVCTISVDSSVSTHTVYTLCIQMCVSITSRGSLVNDESSKPCFLIPISQYCGPYLFYLPYYAVFFSDYSSPQPMMIDHPIYLEFYIIS